LGSSNFRPSTIADKDAIAALLREALGLTPDHPMAGSSHVNWKYWEPHPGWAGSRSYVYLRDDQVVAHAAVIPHVCLWRGHRIEALHVVDWAAKQGFSGSGVALMKQIGKLTDAIFAVGGSELTQQILPVIGFKECGTTVAWYARPVRPLQRLVNPEYKSWRLAPRVIRALFWTLTAPSRLDVEWRAQRVLADQLATASLIWPSPIFGTTVFERSNASMSYLLRCPATPMELYSVHRNGRLRGYFLLAFAPAQGRIIDCWIDSDELLDWSATVQLAVARAKAHPEVAEVVSMSSDPCLGAALVKCGFHIRHTTALWWRAASAAARPDVTIRFLMADNDDAYLHNGCRALWA
jgi:Acetyltransferase (GNAT) domain